MRKSRFGIPYFEITLVIILLCVLALVWADRFFYYRELAEKTVFELTVRNMRSGLWQEKARRIIAGIALDDLPGRNPILYLDTPPPGYLGEKTETEVQQAASGSWFFVASEGALYYKPLMRLNLQASATAITLRIKTDLQIDPPYQWF